MILHDMVEQEIGFRVDNGLLFHGDKPRPATAEEASLWFALLSAKGGVLKLMGEKSQDEADLRSLRASNEAYRALLQKLYDGIKHITHVGPTDDAVEAALALIKQNHKQPIDARSVVDGFGTPAENKL